MGTPDFVVVGHVTRDIVGTQEPRLGGSAAYAALTAHNLGRHVGIVTSCASDIPLDSLPPEIEIANTPAQDTTTFVNEIPPSGLGRTQYVTSKAARLDVEHVPWAWLDTQILLAAPVLDEVDPTMLGRFRKSLVGVAVQGWLRRWDNNPDVPLTRHALSALAVLPPVGVLFLSREDFSENIEAFPQELGETPIGIVTEASEGARLWWQERWHTIQPYPAREVDPTGAGDVFAAAYLVRLSETRDPLEAARFASATASLSVEGEGLSAIPSRQAVEGRLANGE